MSAHTKLGGNTLEKDQQILFFYKRPNNKIGWTLQTKRQKSTNSVAIYIIQEKTNVHDFIQ